MTSHSARKKIIQKFPQVRRNLEIAAGHVGKIVELAQGRPKMVQAHSRAIIGALGLVTEMVDKMESLYRGHPDEPIPSPDEEPSGDGDSSG